MINQVSHTVLYSRCSSDATTLSKNFKNISGEEFGTLPDSMANPETLQAYVDRILSDNPDLSEVKVSKRAKRLGHKISSGYVSNVRTGTSKNPSIRLLLALAAGLGRPEEELIAIAKGKPLKETPMEGVLGVIAKEFATLAASDQKEIAPIIEMLHREIRLRLKS